MAIKIILTEAKKKKNGPENKQNEIALEEDDHNAFKLWFLFFTSPERIKLKNKMPMSLVRLFMCGCVWMYACVHCLADKSSKSIPEKNDVN